MDDELRAFAARHHGVWSTADARTFGYDQRDVNHLVGVEEWHRIRRGWFTDAAAWRTADPNARHRWAAQAALRPLGGREAASHTTGAVLLGLESYEPDLSLVHTTHVAPLPGRTEHGVTHHAGPLDAGRPTLRDELLVAWAPQTVAGAMLLAPHRGALVVGDSALHNGVVTKLELEQVAGLWWRHTGSRALRYRLSLLDGDAENGGETIAREFLRTNGFPRPVLQLEIDGPGGFVARVDFAWPEHGVIVELDGKRKYVRDLRPGEDPGDAVFREKQREDRLRDLGWVVVRLTWADLFAPAATVARLRTAFARGRRIATSASNS